MNWPIAAADAARFWSRVERGAPSACWPWRAGLFTNGYGQFAFISRENGRRVQRPVGAHRVAWALTHGRSIPCGLVVMHACDNKPCCNPAHLSLGTALDNTRDSIAKGRQRYVRGSRHGVAKLTEGEVGDMRRIFAEGGHLQREVAEAFNVSQSTVSLIVRNRIWGHV